MSKFKVGDKVKCIRAKGVVELVEGHVYTVLNCDRFEVFVGTKYDGFFHNRFELVPEFKSGDPVLCVNGASPELEANRIYLIDSVSDGGALVVNGKPWAPARFATSTMDEHRKQHAADIYRTARIRHVYNGWYVDSGTGPCSELYMREDGTWHHMMQNSGETYFRTKELAQSALDRARGIKPAPVVAEPPKPLRPFQVGDTVVCRDIDMCRSKLRLNESYVIRQIYKQCGHLELEGVDSSGLGWNPSRFILGKEAPKLVVTPSQHINIMIPAGASVSVNNRPVDNCVMEPPKPTFAVGSFIRCNDARPHDGIGNKFLVLNRIYQVQECGPNLVTVAGIAYDKRRFTKATLSDYHAQCVADTGFKTGDKVRLKEQKVGWFSEYTVGGFRFIGSKLDGLTLRETGGTFNPAAFELVPEKPKPKFRKGDVVTCIDSSRRINIKAGNQYVVNEWYDAPAIGETQPGSMSVHGADNGDKSHYAAWRFELLKPIAPKPSPIFARGDLVLCIDASPREDGPTHNLVQGGIYCVKFTAMVNRQVIAVESHGSTYPINSDFHASSRFEKYKGAVKPDRGVSPVTNWLQSGYWIANQPYGYNPLPLSVRDYTWNSVGQVSVIR